MLKVFLTWYLKYLELKVAKAEKNVERIQEIINLNLI